ncbi:MAG TPA: RodZ domain-containing protein, partial [Gammaproteobacteria bacterium]
MTDTPEALPQTRQPGQILKRAREGMNLTVAAIATQMNLDLRIIEALEAGDQSKLPAPIFVRGYLRGYARLVGVSEADVLGAYQAQAPQEPTPRAVGMASAPLRPAFRSPAIPWRGLLVTVVLLGLAAAGFLLGPQLLRQFTALPTTTDGAAPDAGGGRLELPAPESAQEMPADAPPPAEPLAETGAETGALDLALPPPAPETSRETAPLPVTEPEPALPGDSDFGTPQTTTGAQDGAPAATVEPVPATPPAVPGEPRLAFTFNGESWVEVRAADGSKLLFDLMRKGQTREVS